jgi:hypothetical protein
MMRVLAHDLKRGEDKKNKKQKNKKQKSSHLHTQVFFGVSQSIN